MYKTQTNRSSLISPRKAAYKAQNGRCYNCDTPMWEGEENAPVFAKKHGLKKGRERHLQCTGEHLVAHSIGGSPSSANIVAACRFCNFRSHRAKIPLTPIKYKEYVKRALQKGCWHQMYNIGT